MSLPDTVDFSQRAIRWKLRSKTLHFTELPAIMGIVNVTPDSFSDGGEFLDPQQAIEHGLRLAAEGATILDIGGESTRPQAEPISETEELRRVIRVVQTLSEQTEVPVSIDTSKAKVASEAIAAGAEIINDVTGLEGEAAMTEVAVSTGVGVCAMHMRGTPRTMQQSENLVYDDVVGEIKQYLQMRYDALVAAGVAADRICLDPGIGFAKTHQHNLALLRRIHVFHELPAPLLVGHSRKGFLAKILGDKEKNRTHATVGVSLSLAAKGIQVVRVHDVSATHDAIKCFAAAGGIPFLNLDSEAL